MNLSHEYICRLIAKAQDIVSDLISQDRVTHKDVDHLYTAFMELQRVFNPHFDEAMKEVKEVKGGKKNDN